MPTPAATHSSRTLLGSSTSFIIFPEHDIAVSVMTNTDDATLWPIALEIAQVFAEQKDRRPDRD